MDFQLLPNPDTNFMCLIGPGAVHHLIHNSLAGELSRSGSFLLSVTPQSDMKHDHGYVCKFMSYVAEK